MKWNAKGDFEMFLLCLMKLFADIEESFQERGLVHEWCRLNVLWEAATSRVLQF